jgi:hypothetical protein
VIRAGEVKQISVGDIVVGDICQVSVFFGCLKSLPFLLKAVFFSTALCYFTGEIW